MKPLVIAFVVILVIIVILAVVLGTVESSEIAGGAINALLILVTLLGTIGLWILIKMRY